MIKTICLIFLILLGVSCVKNVKFNNNNEFYNLYRTNIKNSGMANCLYKFSKNNKKKSGYGATQGGYYQRGKHTTDTYFSIDKYVENNFKNKNRHTNEEVSVILSCLEIYNSSEYDKLARKYDNQLNPNDETEL